MTIVKVQRIIIWGLIALVFREPCTERFMCNVKDSLEINKWVIVLVHNRVERKIDLLTKLLLIFLHCNAMHHYHCVYTTSVQPFKRSLHFKYQYLKLHFLSYERRCEMIYELRLKF